MKKFVFDMFALVACTVIFGTGLLAQTFTWNGSSSSDWSVSTNWTPNGVPGVGHTVNINNSAVPNVCVLDDNRSVATLNVNTGASLNFNGFQLVVTATATINNAVLLSTNLQATNFSGFANNTFNGSTTLIKSAGSENLLTGGNVFNGNLSVTHSSGAMLRFSNSVGDTIYGNTILTRTSNGSLRMAHNGFSYFDGNITLNNSTSGTFVFGEANGTSTISSGHALLTSGFSAAALNLRRVIQLGTSANGSFSPSGLTVFQSSFGGSIVMNSTGSLAFNNTSFLSSGIFSGTDITMTGANNFSTLSGTTTITKTGGTSNFWAGGNTFGNVVFNNNTTNRTITLANSNPDSFIGNATFNHAGTGGFSIARSGANTFAGTITLNNSSTGTMQFGANNGTTTIASGGALLTDGFTSGVLTLRRVTQNGNSANGNFQPTTFNAFTNTNFGGSISVVCSGVLTIQASQFSGSNIFTGGQVILNGANSFSTVSGSTVITKTGTTSNSWAGGNTFGTLTVNNNSTASLTLANTVGDTYQSSVVFNKNNTGNIQIARSGSNTFGGNVTVNNTTSGTISFGINNGNSTISPGYALLTEGFTSGDLVLRRITQNGSATNGNFQPVNFSATFNNVIRGDISVVASGTITISSSSFVGSNIFTGGRVLLNNSNNFSTVSGSTVITKNAGSSDDWTGGNTFGPVVVNNNSSSQITLANSNGDTFLSTSVFNKNGTGQIRIARSGANTFAGNITINNTSTGDMSFGINNGTSVIASGAALLTDGFTNGNLILRRVTQNGSATNGNFQPVNFSATLNNIIRGDISVVASGTITFTSSSFRATNTFTAPSIAVTNACSFSTGSGSTTFTKTGTANNDWDGGNTFGNVVFNMNAASGRLRLANSAADTYNGNATFLRNAAGDLQPAYNGNNIFTRNISTSGTSHAVTFAASNGRVIFQGTQAQNIQGDIALYPVFRRVTMNKSSNAVTLNVPIDISTNITFTNGRLISDATNLITILNGATVTGASNASFVRGPVRKVGNAAFTFPIGDGAFYGPIGISAPSNNTHHFTAEYFKESPDSSGYTTSSLAATLDNVSACEYWQLDRTNGNSNVFVTLHWDDTRCGGVNVLSELSVGKWDGTEWLDLGNGLVTGTTSLGTVRTALVVSSFSPFVLSSTTSNNPLPITLLSFDALAQDAKTVNVLWSTASERENDFFTVEKSKDGINWEIAGTVSGQGNSILVNNYSFVDSKPFVGLSYYRLKQTDFNGDYEYFDPKSVFLTEENVISVHPNPATDIVRISGSEEELSQISVINSLGQVVDFEIVQSASSSTLKTLNISNLSKGVYYILTLTQSCVLLKD